MLPAVTRVIKFSVQFLGTVCTFCSPAAATSHWRSSCFNSDKNYKRWLKKTQKVKGMRNATWCNKVDTQCWMQYHIIILLKECNEKVRFRCRYSYQIRFSIAQWDVGNTEVKASVLGPLHHTTDNTVTVDGAGSVWVRSRTGTLLSTEQICVLLPGSDKNLKFSLFTVLL